VELRFFAGLTNDQAAEALQKNQSVDGAFVITPDMLALTGAESTVKGAHVLVSTKERRRTIADAYFVRHDWAQAHQEDLRNFVAAYLYSMEAVKTLQEAYDGSGSPEYKALMSFASQTLSAVPTFEDADGLYRDATCVGHSGAVAFIDPQNKEGISTFVTRSNAIARELNLAANDFQINVAPVDLSHAVFNSLKTKGLARKAAFNAEATRAQLEQMTNQGTLGKNKSLSFSAGYAPNQTTFDASQYKAEFDRILELMGSYSTAPVAIRCHADTLIVVGSMLQTGMEAGVISRQGTPGNWSYYIDGAPLDIGNASKIGGLIHDPRFNSKKVEGQSPTEIAGAAKTLTEERCRNARDSFLAYAKSKGSKISETQVVAQGVGIAEPVVVLPRSEKETAANRRVELSVVRVEVEASNPSFDY
jgi:outer membrane protein OmpA-like peptidoglycan-associated protein